MTQFILTLTNNTDDCQLIFDVNQSSIAKRWADEVAKNYPLLETTRFINWPNDGKNTATFVEKLNAQIATINNWKPGTIPEVLSDPLDQDLLNHLHRFFVKLQGNSTKASDFYLAAPTHVQEAICNFNLTIHEYEHFAYNQETVKLTNHPYATIVGTFANRPRYKLEDSDYDKYTFKWTFGTVYINYCEVGKPILDIFKDQDEITEETGIVPLHYYSADFQIKFGPSTLDHIYDAREKQLWQWFDNNKNKFQSLGFTKSKYLAVGMIPVATLNIVESNLSHLTPVEIVNYVGNFLKIKSVCVK